jgi:hypothetical protein
LDDLDTTVVSGNSKVAWQYSTVVWGDSKEITKEDVQTNVENLKKAYDANKLLN